MRDTEPSFTKNSKTKKPQQLVKLSFIQEQKQFLTTDKLRNMALGPECCWTLTEGHEQLDKRMRCWSIKLSSCKFWDKFWLNVSVPHSNTVVSPRSLSLEKFLSHETSLAARREEIQLYLHAGYWRFFRFCSALFIFLWKKAHWIFCFSLFFGLFRVWIKRFIPFPYAPPPPRQKSLASKLDVTIKNWWRYMWYKGLDFIMAF